MFAWSTLTWLTSYAQSFEQLLILRMALGLSAAFNFPAALALVSDYHRGPTRSLATGIHQTGYTIGIALGGLGGILADWRSWRFAFSVVGLAGMAYCGVIVSPAPGPAPGCQERERGCRQQTRRSLWCGDQKSFQSRLLHPGFCQHGPSRRSRLGDVGLDAGVPAGAISPNPGGRRTIFHGLCEYGGVAGLLVGGLWADRWSRTTPVPGSTSPSSVFSSSGHPVRPHVAANTGVLTWPSWADPLPSFHRLYRCQHNAVLCETVDQRHRATAYGLVNMMAAFAGGLGIYAGGVLRDRKFDPSIPFDFVALFVLLSAILFYLVRTQRLALGRPSIAVGKALPGEGAPE